MSKPEELDLIGDLIAAASSMVVDDYRRPLGFVVVPQWVADDPKVKALMSEPVDRAQALANLEAWMQAGIDAAKVPR